MSDGTATNIKATATSPPPRAPGEDDGGNGARAKKKAKKRRAGFLLFKARAVAKTADARTKKAAASADASASQPASKKKKKKAAPTFCAYNRKLVKHMHPNLRCDRLSLSVGDALIRYLLDKIAADAVASYRIGNKQTMMVCDVAAAIKQLFPPGIGLRAMGCGELAVKAFAASEAAAAEDSKDLDIETTSP
jgi:hypothetical protein